MKPKHILPKKISNNNYFAGLNLAIVTNGEEEVYVIILHFYKSNIQIHQERRLSLYHKIDSTIFWFINTIVCQQYLILACFI